MHREVEKSKKSKQTCNGGQIVPALTRLLRIVVPKDVVSPEDQSTACEHPRRCRNRLPIQETFRLLFRLDRHESILVDEMAMAFPDVL